MNRSFQTLCVAALAWSYVGGCSEETSSIVADANIEDAVNVDTVSLDTNEHWDSSEPCSSCSCLPYVQKGCDPEEKCSFGIESLDPFLGRTDCVPNGDVAIGEDCVFEHEYYDNCLAGAYCYVNVCAEICDTREQLCDKGTCVAVPDIFEDVAFTGLCQEPADTGV